MKLPIVQGWLFDFRAARKAVESGRNARIDHIADGCEVGKIRICHLEKSFFRDNPRLNEIFLGDDKCVCDISEAIVANCRLVNDNLNGLKLPPNNFVPVYLTGIAMTLGYGVVADYNSISYATTHHLCNTNGINVFTSEEYFNFLGI